MSTTRVVIPLLAHSVSGGVRSVLAIANGLADNGVNVRIYSPGYAPVPRAGLRPSVELVTIQASGPAQKLRYALKLISSLARERGLFVATGYKTPLYIHLSQFLAGRRARVVSLIQSYEPLTHVKYGAQPAVLKPFLRAVAKIGYLLPAYRIAVSQFVAEHVGADRISSIINPGIGRDFIDLIPASPALERHSFTTADGGDRDVVVGFFPPVGPVKGLRFAVGAAEHLRGAGAGMKFLVYDIDYQAAGLPDFILRFSGRTGSRSIVEFYRSCHVFVYPSLVEGFGLPPLEAMACGTPVILTDSGGVREYAQDGENCILVRPGSAEAIAGALQKITGDPDLVKRLIAGGFRTARRFPQERFVDSCVERISTLLAPPPISANKG